ncbi:hypothetical protein E4U48_004355 [Claviceps purpurea]|nr:hypothetical protein E4U48_004355 [Claviceps purpurea]
MGDVGMYDGTEPAERWLKRLEVLFAGANNGEAVDPSTCIKIIDVSLVWSAAAFADSSTHLRDIMKRAGEGKAVDADLDSLTFLPEERDKTANPEPRQGEFEVLEAYYSRCQSLVLRSGGRVKPLDSSDSFISLNQTEGYILRDFIFKFVNGLYDKVNLRSSRPTILDAKAWFYAGRLTVPTKRLHEPWRELVRTR